MGSSQEVGQILEELSKICDFLLRSQEPQQYMDTYVDTDYAGCMRTRRSTNGGMVIWGNHLIRSCSTTQTVIALSSGEAEYYGITKGACESIGVKGIASDLGVQLKIRLHTDTSAAKGIAMRKGLGKVKHLETRTLWVQDKVEDGTIVMRKIPGNDNIADLLTKYLSAEKIQRFVHMLPLEAMGGRHSLAPKLQG